MNVLHATDIRTYQECRRKFYYNNILRLAKGDGEKPNYFEVGTQGHAILAAHYNKEDVNSVIEAIPDSENRQLLKILYRLYKKYYEEVDQNFQTLSIENEFKVELLGVPIVFRADWIFLDKVYKLMDHKFYTSFPQKRNIDFDFQLTFYLWAINKLGIRCNHAILNCIKKTVPREPKLLVKSFSLSRAKSELDATEYDIYLEAINRAGLKPEEYKEELDYLKQRGSQTFLRISTRRTDAALKEFEEDLKYIIEEIAEATENPRKFYPMPNAFCYKCPFEFLCELQNNGKDINNSIYGMYRVKGDDER